MITQTNLGGSFTFANRTSDVLGTVLRQIEQ